ncbi:MAG: hypothetical protein FWE67_11665, partial [Planctomycetaceae bacterium]|nr:hypothetical protein [Planctomycetaceae bacterium]
MAPIEITVLRCYTVLMLKRNDSVNYSIRTMRVPFIFIIIFCLMPQVIFAQVSESDLNKVISRGLEWLAKDQSRQGSWDANGMYPSAMTGMAG